MKNNVCCKCHCEIDSQDFFMNSKNGKICSDCLVNQGPLEAENAHLFKPRGPKNKSPKPKEQRGAIITLPLKEAL